MFGKYIFPYISLYHVAISPRHQLGILHQGFNRMAPGRPPSPSAEEKKAQRQFLSFQCQRHRSLKTWCNEEQGMSYTFRAQQDRKEWHFPELGGTEVEDAKSKWRWVPEKESFVPCSVDQASGCGETREISLWRLWDLPSEGTCALIPG